MRNDSKTIEGELVEINRGGRPSSYRPERALELKELLGQGYGKAQISAHWGISRQTLDNWLKRNEDLQKAFDAGQPQAEAWWMEVGTAGMLGKVKGFNATIWMANMNNRFGWSRKDKDNMPQINIENMQVLQNMEQLNDAELDGHIHLVLEKLGISDGTEPEDGTSSTTG